MKHFIDSIIITLVGLGFAFHYGSWTGIYITVLLVLLEVSLSFDNAVVNARILETMTPKWQKLFIWVGLPIAVFGMRFIFPIAIVAVTAGMGFTESYQLAFDDPKKYEELLSSNLTYINSFGGAFLLIVGLGFFFDEDRSEKWIEWVEGNKITQSLSKVENIELIIAITIGMILTYETLDYKISMYFFSGVLLHSVLNSLDSLLESPTGVRSGILGLLYLEVLDASFSFDGVIGAFAISTNIIVIAIGLGIGAAFVRSLTLYLVEKKTLNEYIYLEHGAHYAIISLAILMFVKIFVHVNELITGTIGIGIIIFAFIHSLKENKKRQAIENSGK